MQDFTELYCKIDDFIQSFYASAQARILKGAQIRQRSTCISESEIITLLVMSHHLHYRPFKAFYNHFAIPFLKSAFPTLPSYQRFIELAARCLLPLFGLLKSLTGHNTGLSFVDSTPLPVCKNPRIHQHATFAEHAARGKSSTGWFYGFKLHVLFNHRAEIVNFNLSAGNVDDRTPVESMCKKQVNGLLVGDKGYLGQAFGKRLEALGIKLITKVKRNMKPIVLTDFERAILKKRAIVETAFGQMKEQFELHHTRHRSVTGMVLNVFSAMVAYCLKLNKPRIKGLDTQPLIEF